MFYIDYIEGRKIVKSDLIDEVLNFFTTRDICIHSKEEDVSYNREIIEKYIGQKMATNHPVHGVDVIEVVDNKYFYNNTDGLLLKKGCAGYMNFGDCVPLIFYANDVALISHAGWRGTAQSIAKISVDRLIKETGCSVLDIKAVIGPSICFNCYEVGKDDYDALFSTVDDKKGIFKKENEKYFVDLKGINKQQMLEMGVIKIDVCPFCTNCGEKMFYSYRFENKTGYRHSAVVKCR